ncbi:hypothetical protein NESM_000382000 [Novymonas esmeraldas]|uniref:Uncharacterized protein n=1 Tax=Novymonas esmeraldas TaxID=1808958 RepID=A0AAW0EKM1_9TRYP
MSSQLSAARMSVAETQARDPASGASQAVRRPSLRMPLSLSIPVPSSVSTTTTAAATAAAAAVESAPPPQQLSSPPPPPHEFSPSIRGSGECSHSHHSSSGGSSSRRRRDVPPAHAHLHERQLQERVRELEEELRMTRHELHTRQHCGDGEAKREDERTRSSPSATRSSDSHAASAGSTHEDVAASTALVDGGRGPQCSSNTTGAAVAASPIAGDVHSRAAAPARLRCRHGLSLEQLHHDLRRCASEVERLVEDQFNLRRIVRDALVNVSGVRERTREEETPPPRAPAASWTSDPPAPQPDTRALGPLGDTDAVSSPPVWLTALLDSMRVEHAEQLRQMREELLVVVCHATASIQRGHATHPRDGPTPRICDDSAEYDERPRAGAMVEAADEARAGGAHRVEPPHALLWQRYRRLLSPTPPTRSEVVEVEACSTRLSPPPPSSSSSLHRHDALWSTVLRMQDLLQAQSAQLSRLEARLPAPLPPDVVVRNAAHRRTPPPPSLDAHLRDGPTAVHSRSGARRWEESVTSTSVAESAISSQHDVVAAVAAKKTRTVPGSHGELARQRRHEQRHAQQQQQQQQQLTVVESVAADLRQLFCDVRAHQSVSAASPHLSHHVTRARPVSEYPSPISVLAGDASSMRDEGDVAHHRPSHHAATDPAAAAAARAGPEATSSTPPSLPRQRARTVLTSSLVYHPSSSLA